MYKIVYTNRMKKDAKLMKRKGFVYLLPHMRIHLLKKPLSNSAGIIPALLSLWTAGFEELVQSRKEWICCQIILQMYLFLSAIES